MAMNISKIAQATPYSFNDTLVNSTGSMVTNSIDQTNIATGGQYAIAILLITYIYIFIVLHSEQGRYRLDMIQSSVFASGVCFMFAAMLLIFGFVPDVSVLSLFGVVLFVSSMAMYINRRKG